MNMMRLSAWLSVAVGAALGIAQAVRNYDNWANWPTWMLDEGAAVMLLVGGLLSLRRGGSRVLIAAWGIAVGLYGSALVSHLTAMADPLSPAHKGAHVQLAIVITALLGVTVVGLGMTLAAKPKTAA